jgi:hypothetical protein
MHPGLTSCPESISVQKRCSIDTSWYENTGWAVKMSVSFQNASVAYSRKNGTILWHSFGNNKPSATNVVGADILKAYDTLLFDTTKLKKVGNQIVPVADADLPLFSGSLFSTYIWWTEPAFNGGNAANPATSNQIFNTLQALLTIPLNMCQNGFGRRLIPYASAAKSLEQANNAGQLMAFLSPLPERTSSATFATHRYQAVASMPTLIAYIVLSGTSIVLCFLAQVLSIYMVRRSGRDEMLELSQFPALDLFSHCTIEDENNYVVYQGRSGGFHQEGQSQLGWLSTLQVKWSRPYTRLSELQMFRSY